MVFLPAEFFYFLAELLNIPLQGEDFLAVLFFLSLSLFSYLRDFSALALTVLFFGKFVVGGNKTSICVSQIVILFTFLPVKAGLYQQAFIGICHMNEHNQNPNLIHKLWNMDSIGADGIIHDVFGVVQGNGCFDGTEPFFISQRVDCKIHFGATLHKAAKQVTYTLPVWLILLNSIRSGKFKIREPEFARAGLKQPLIFDSFQCSLQLFPLCCSIRRLRDSLQEFTPVLVLLPYFLTLSSAPAPFLADK